jgi:hydrogenase nickel incorporation protein HypA/HybF
MHEFSLACHVLEIVEENLNRQNATKVSELTLEIGSMAGVELQALKLSMDSLQQNTILEGTFIHYQIVQATAICQRCHFRFEPAESFSPCPQCNSFKTDILTGKELIVKSMVIE